MHEFDNFIKFFTEMAFHCVPVCVSCDYIISPNKMIKGLNKGKN